LGETHIGLTNELTPDSEDEVTGGKIPVLIIRPAFMSPSDSFEIGWRTIEGVEHRALISRFVAASIIETLANALAQALI
jgi:hypothetical protein